MIVREGVTQQFETYSGPIWSVAVSGGVFTKTMTFQKAGDRNDGHSHYFDHTTTLVHGAIRFECDNEPDQEIRAEVGSPVMFLTPAGKLHRIIALEDNTVVMCIHALRDANGVPLPVDTPDEIALGYCTLIARPEPSPAI